jgi:ribosomal protein L16/L10AE
MYHHPETLLALHKERHARLEANAARYALTRSLRRRRRRWWRRPTPQHPPVRLKPLLR